MDNQQVRVLDHVVVNAGFAPVGRKNNLVVTELADEVLVYDQARHHIHRLNRSAAAVWRLCDGKRTISELAMALRPEFGPAVNAAVVELALAELGEANLLDQPVGSGVTLPAESRRSVLRKLGLAGAVALVPAIVSITAPVAADGDSCTQGSTCQDNCPGTGQCINNKCNCPK